MTDIARRYITLSGEVSENNYQAGRYFVGGRDLNEAAVDLQRDVFAFVADQDIPVTVTFAVEIGPEDGIDRRDFSGIAKFVGFQAASAVAAVQRTEVTYTGTVIEPGIGTFYMVQGDSNVNLSAALTRMLAETIDKHVQTKEYVSMNLDIIVEEAVQN